MQAGARARARARARVEGKAAPIVLAEGQRVTHRGGARIGPYIPCACCFWGWKTALAFASADEELATIGWYPGIQGKNGHGEREGAETRNVTEIRLEGRSRSGCTCRCSDGEASLGPN